MLLGLVDGLVSVSGLTNALIGSSGAEVSHGAVRLRTLSVVSSIREAAGSTPLRAAVADDRYLYVSVHTMNSVRKFDLITKQVVGVVATGTKTRSMAPEKR